MRSVRQIVFGEHPRALLVLCVPTLLAVVLDLSLRGRALAHYIWYGKLFYVGSILLSLAFWWLPLFVAARLAARARETTSAGPRVGLVALFGLFVFPLATFCFPGQILYHRVVDAYMGRDTLRLGITFRTTLRDWFVSWAGPGVVLVIVGAGLFVTLLMALAVRRAAATPPGSTPALAVVVFVASLVCFWRDLCDSRYLQAATPDACFLHSLVHTVQIAASGQWNVRQGVSLRTPAALPPLTSERQARPNVVVILTESVRADTFCSDPPPACKASELDQVAADRIPLGKLTTPTPNTFSSCVFLWTGLSANVDFKTAHSAPVLWELAHAVGYRTAYITSQNGAYEDFGVFVRKAGIDELALAAELGGMEQEQLGAPDERATDAALKLAREATGPYFALVQLANTHMPYRVDPALQPYEPHSPNAVGDVVPFKNQYKNSVLLQERTVAAFLRELRALPSWDDTVVIFMSDHGEQFREHHGLYHNHSLYEEELRIPGFLVAGARALDDGQRAALRTFAGKRTYTQDVHATVVDLFGLDGAHAALPYGDKVVGRSLLRPRTTEPKMLLATSTAVWEPTDARFGVMLGERVLVGSPIASWSCFDLVRDPSERKPLPAERCADLLEVAQRELVRPEVRN